MVTESVEDPDSLMGCRVSDASGQERRQGQKPTGADRFEPACRGTDLEHVSQMAGPGDAGAEDNGSAVGDGELVVARGQSPPLFE